MNKVDFDLKVYDNIIEITPNEGIKDNSIYEIRIRSIKALDKNNYTENLALKVATRLTPSYCSLEAVQSIVEDYQIPEDRILYYIREASLFVEYIKKSSYPEGETAPFEVIQYTKYKAAYDSLMRFYISRSAEGGVKGTLGEIQFENSSSFPAMKDLLDSLRREIKEWEDHLHGYGFKGIAKPQAVMKGSNTSTIYGTSFTDFSRGVTGR